MRGFRSPLLLIVSATALVAGSFFAFAPVESIPLGSLHATLGSALTIQPYADSPLAQSPVEIDVTWGGSAPDCDFSCSPTPAFMGLWYVAIRVCGPTPCTNLTQPKLGDAAQVGYGGSFSFSGLFGRYYSIVVGNALANQSANSTIPIQTSEVEPAEGGWPGAGAAVIGAVGIAYAIRFGREPLPLAGGA